MPVESDKLRQHADIWRAKPVLRAVYNDCYRRILKECVDGKIIEIGGGSGNLKEYRSDIVSTDVQYVPWVDIVADAHVLPFRDASAANIVMFDVLHHLERPRLFLAEAVRVLAPGGRIIVCEPAITFGSYLFYKMLHPEPVRLREDPLAEGPLSRDRDPFDANQAIPGVLLGRNRARLHDLFPHLHVRRCGYFSFLAYPLSGGFRPWSLLPGRLANPLLRLEAWCEPVLGRLFGFRLLGVIERR